VVREEKAVTHHVDLNLHKLYKVIARFEGRKGGQTPTHALSAPLAMRIK
jgi:hypothetical protein